MLVRLLVIVLLATTTFAGDLFKDWPRGMTEMLWYDINTIMPQKTTNSLEMKITKTTGDTPTFEINQNLKITNQNIDISVTEIYNGGDFQLAKTINCFQFPAELRTQLGIDSLVITGVRTGDSLDITSNSSRMAPPCKVPVDKGLVTSSGSLLTTRNMSFTVGETRTFRYINLLMLTGQIYTPLEITDSVVGDAHITVPAGTFDCYKVKNSVAGSYGYSYYSKEKGHPVIRTELIDPETSEIVMEVVLNRREQSTK
ncbi:MAG: hypothetical protein JW763_05750 [candidate division Zixibacteria bacterium]|nr:hypothetical protein [candidate division Zixibacteria bacterium]